MQEVRDRNRKEASQLIKEPIICACDTCENLRQRGGATCQVSGVGPEEGGPIHTCLADHLLQLHTLRSDAVQVLSTHGRVSAGQQGAHYI